MPGPLTWSGCGCVNHNYIESCRWKGILPLAALYAYTWEHVVRSNSV